MKLRFSGTKIMMERVNQGLSMTEVCNGADLDSKTLSRIERGLTNPRPDTVGKIAIVLKKRVEDFQE